jgi:hypothetical protein
MLQRRLAESHRRFEVAYCIHLHIQVFYPQNVGITIFRDIDYYSTVDKVKIPFDLNQLNILFYLFPRLLRHDNVEAIQLLDNGDLLRRLRRTKPFELVP